MLLARANPGADKGWYFGSWNTPLAISVGFASTGIDEPHRHAVTAELYLVARGTAVIQVERQTVTLTAGDVLVVDAGEAHTFRSSTPDYFHFVVHTPGLSGDGARADKQAVPRAALGCEVAGPERNCGR